MKTVLTFILITIISYLTFGQPIQPNSNLDSKIILIDTKESLNEQLKQFNGKIVYLDMWSTFCAPCIKQFQYKKALNDFFESNEIVMLCICVDRERNKSKWETLIQEHSVTGYHTFVEFSFMSKYKSNFDISSENYRSFGMGYPHFLIIDENGNVVEENAYSPEKKEKLVEQLRNYIN